MPTKRRGVVLARVDARHDEQWLLEALSNLVEIPGVEGIAVERLETDAAEYLQLVVEFGSASAWRRFTAREDACWLLSSLEFELERAG